MNQNKIKNKLRKIDSFRKKLLAPLELGFLKLISNKKYSQTQLLKKEEIKKVLIVRNNTRIGNMFFLLPFVNETKKAYANAKIDLLLTNEWQGSFFSNLDINKIHYSNFRFKSIMKFFVSMQKLKKEEYDLILVPFGSSSDYIISSFLKAKNCVAFNNKKSQILYSHSFDSKNIYKHYALKPLELLQELNQEQDIKINPYMNFSYLEIKKGQEDFLNTLKNSEKTHTITFFRGARGKKIIDDSVWKEIIFKMQTYYKNDLNIIEILSDDISNKLIESSYSYKNNNLRQLASYLKNCDVFLCADTGPLHLANASNVKTIGLFNKTKIEVYGCLGEESINISDIKNFEPKEVLQTLELEFKRA